MISGDHVDRHAGGPDSLRRSSHIQMAFQFPVGGQVAGKDDKIQRFPLVFNPNLCHDRIEKFR